LTIQSPPDVPRIVSVSFAIAADGCGTGAASAGAASMPTDSVAAAARPAALPMELDKLMMMLLGWWVGCRPWARPAVHCRRGGRTIQIGGCCLAQCRGVH